MTVSANHPRNANYKHVLTPTFTLVLCGLLSACSDSAVTEPQTAPEVASTPVVAVGPSLSAAQLSNDSTVTVQNALALVTDEAVLNTRPIDSPEAAAPDLVDALTPTTDSNAVDTELENSDSDADPTSLSTTPGEPTPASELVEENNSDVTDEVDSTPAAEVAQNTGNTTDEVNSTPAVEVSENTSNTTDDVENAPAIGAATDVNTTTDQQPEANPDLVQTSNSDNNAGIQENVAQNRFVSVTTPGFEGEVLENAIRIEWAEDPTARGYNVYRQADYYTTVFDNEFVDTDVFDDDYYYEIQAFDNDDRFSYVATGLTVKARSFERTDPDAPVPNAALLDDYELVFSDEFNNTTLDTSKWNTSFLWGTDLFINSEEQYYVDVVNDPDFGFNPFTFDGEHLTINTIETPAELSAKAQGQPYLSGIITSYDAFKFTYGYVETRAKFTHGRGYWPAFWLLNAYYVDAEPEIDIMEFIGDNQDVIYHTYHYFDAQGELRSTKSFPVPGIDYTADFHTFGVEWKPGTLIFYVDGIETQRIVDANVSQQEMYVLANQAVGGWWAGPPDGTTPFPGKYVIDYIRVYQQITPLEIIQFDQSTDIIPLFQDSPGQVLPNHRPPFWLWPEGYPEGP